ncbi:MAG TPA: pyruvate, water dikinase regulatory protein [Gammaproteobacteria bacterium]|nr:pyruvate, water dikinase regulatory protein [Gammaproteobacteria bacterium]
MNQRSVFFISDGTGLTVESLANSLLAQFQGFEFRNVTIPFVNTDDKARRAVERVNAAHRETGMKPLVFSTLVDPKVRHVVSDHAEATCFDLYDAYLGPLEKALGAHPLSSIGRSHGVADHGRYVERMEAVNFALRTDDGSAVARYDQADVIVIGVSRSGKTPTCLYLALQYGIRAANYPLTDEDLENMQLPALLRPHRDRLYGLIIDPQRLQEIRSERRPDSRYASTRQCRYEVRQVAAIYRREGLQTLDTTSMSVEEIASTIVHDAGLKRPAR